jgi:hypothetical protein
MEARSGWLGRVTMMWIPSSVGIAGVGSDSETWKILVILRTSVTCHGFLAGKRKGKLSQRFRG